MNLGQFIPEICMAGTALAVILIDLFTERKGILAVVSIVGIIVAAAFTAFTQDAYGTNFGGLIAYDGFAIFFKLLFMVIAALVILASTDYIEKLAGFRGEFYALIMISALGMMLMASARELITLYISLELSSISLYVLAGFLKNGKSTEASLKYLLLGATASAVLLYGMALVFGTTGSTRLDLIGDAVRGIAPDSVGSSPALIAGIIMMIAGFGFKIAAVPFQMWVPDVYEGAPTPVTAYLSVASKAAGFAIIMRVFFTAFGAPDWLGSNWGMIFAVLSVITMLTGNLVAIKQENIKRMLGYSGIAQAGYLMVGVATMGMASAFNEAGQSSIMFFLASYSLTNLGVFAGVIAISRATGSDQIAGFSGMIKRSPLLTLAMTLCLFSLVGMPPAAGFIAKFYVFSNAVQNDLLWLVIVAALNSVISAFYYLRVVKVMWFGTPASEEKIPSSIALRITMALCAVGVLVLGTIPAWAMDLAESARILITG